MKMMIMGFHRNCTATRANLRRLGAYNKKTTFVPVLSLDHPSKDLPLRSGDEFLTEGGPMTENSSEGGFQFIMILKI